MGRSVGIGRRQAFILVFTLLLGAMPAPLFGDLFAGIGPVEQRNTIVALGMLFGGGLCTLVLLGAIVVPGELIGVLRSSSLGSNEAAEARATARRVLLTAVAILSWVVCMAAACIMLVVAGAAESPT